MTCSTNGHSCPYGHDHFIPFHLFCVSSPSGLVGNMIIVVILYLSSALPFPWILRNIIGHAAWEGILPLVIFHRVNFEFELEGVSEVT